MPSSPLTWVPRRSTHHRWQAQGGSVQCLVATRSVVGHGCRSRLLLPIGFNTKKESETSQKCQKGWPGVVCFKDLIGSTFLAKVTNHPLAPHVSCGEAPAAFASSEFCKLHQDYDCDNLALYPQQQKKRSFLGNNIYYLYGIVFDAACSGVDDARPQEWKTRIPPDFCQSISC